MLAASIGYSDPWVMSASCGAITLTPVRMMSVDERRATAEESVLLNLTDLGHLSGTADTLAISDDSPMRHRSEVVLLLPWSLASVVAELDVLARFDVGDRPRNYAPEDWLTTWHHFVEANEWQPAVKDIEIRRQTDSLRGLPFVGMRHFVLGSVATEASTHEYDMNLVLNEILGRSPLTPTLSSVGSQTSDEVDPLIFTNPGSAPEGLSPLFVTGARRAAGMYP